MTTLRQIVRKCLMNPEYPVQEFLAVLVAQVNSRPHYEFALFLSRL